MSRATSTAQLRLFSHPPPPPQTALSPAPARVSLWAALVYPRLALEVLREAVDDAPWVVVDEVAGQQRVIAASSPAEAAGVAAGMALSVFNELDYPKEKTDLVLNWNFQSQGLPRGEIESALKKEISIVIPHVPDTIVSAITMGKPPILDEEESPLRALLEDLAYHWSEPSQKKKRPETPSEFWQRVAERARKRAKKSS